MSASARRRYTWALGECRPCRAEYALDCEWQSVVWLALETVLGSWVRGGPADSVSRPWVIGGRADCVRGHRVSGGSDVVCAAECVCRTSVRGGRAV